MVDWLQKIITSVSGVPQLRTGLPVKTNPNRLPTRGMPLKNKKALPNAAVIYGTAASVLFMVSLFSIISGSWVSGLLVLLPAAGFLGFAMHFIKHQ
jgi:hypothetical protein